MSQEKIAEYELEAKQCFARLDTTDEKVIKETADRLGCLGVWIRGSINPRGSLLIAAPEAANRQSLAALTRHLGAIGGPVAALTLAEVITSKSFSDREKSFAIHAIEELITGGAVDDSEGPDWSVRVGLTGKKQMDEVLKTVRSSLYGLPQSLEWEAREIRRLIDL